MTTALRVLLGVAAGAVVVGAVPWAPVVLAAPAVSAPAAGSGPATPVVVPERYEVAIGDTIEVIVAGFTSRTVTVSVCGNAALRGSADCAMTASESDRTSDDGSPRHLDLTVTAPPEPCPCLIRASSRNNDEVATANITVIGHRVAQPVRSEHSYEALVVSVRAERSPGGAVDWLRSQLGGASRYEVSYTVGNTTTSAADDVNARAVVGRGPTDVITQIDVPVPARLAPGETWAYTTDVELPATAWGDAHWRIDVTSSTPVATASDVSTHRPILLFVLVGVLVIDLLVLGSRRIVLIRARSHAGCVPSRRRRPEGRRGSPRLASARSRAESEAKMGSLRSTY